MLVKEEQDLSEVELYGGAIKQAVLTPGLEVCWLAPTPISLGFLEIVGPLRNRYVCFTGSACVLLLPEELLPEAWMFIGPCDAHPLGRGEDEGEEDFGFLPTTRYHHLVFAVTLTSYLVHDSGFFRSISCHLSVLLKMFGSP